MRQRIEKTTPLTSVPSHPPENQYMFPYSSAVCASDAQSVRSVSVFHPCFSPLPHSCLEAFPAHAPADAPI